MRRLIHSRLRRLKNGDLTGVVPSFVKTWFFVRRNRRKRIRNLEIGPGQQRMSGFETLNVVDDTNVDYIWDAAKRLPFPDETFDLVYASHILEHIPWYLSEQVLSEWNRVLKYNGQLEVWVPNGLRICTAWVAAETGESTDYLGDGWFRFNERRDPCLWASGRIFTYGDGKGTINDPNWHRALFSPRFLQELLKETGFSEVVAMAPDEVRGVDHGWINMGFRARKV